MIKKIKKGVAYVANLLSILVVIASVVLMLGVVFTARGAVPNVMGYSFLRVLTDSMKPELPVDTLILVKRVGVEEIKEGDIISFYSADPYLDGMINTHRITRIESQNGEYIIYTKGDANAMEDEYSVDSDSLVGKVIWKNAFIGKLVRLAVNPLIFIPIIIAPLLMILIYHFRQIIYTTKAISNEQEEAYQEALARILEKKRKEKEAKKDQEK